MTEGTRALSDWFSARGWKVAPFQSKVWRHYLDGKSGMLISPTGSGKTLAVLGGPLIEALDEAVHEKKNSIKLLWITPLRALASDTTKAIRHLVDDLGLDWAIVQRTGDSTSRERRLVRKGKAEIVVITPESLALLLTYPESRDTFAGVRCIVVDEWHELMSNKRGVLLQLTLSRLCEFAVRAKIWGISATIGDPVLAARALIPNGDKPVLVEVRPRKGIKIETLIPKSDKRLPWSGHLGLSQLDSVYDRIMDAQTTLLFTNTRAQAELWFKALQSIWQDGLHNIALHHGSLDPELRRSAELGLKDGTIRCVVATSSLDLGVDFPTVEQVIQIGSPKGISRLIQRAGRSRHRPGEVGNVICVPTQALDVLEYAAAREAIKQKRIESPLILHECWDVLAQHCVSIALSEGLEPVSTFNTVKKTLSYSNITQEQFNSVIDFLVRGGSSLEKYPDYHRLDRAEDGRLYVTSRRIAMRHRMSIGTIASDGSMLVKMLRGGHLGSIEENFISRIKAGERFTFAGRTLELVRTDRMVVYVRNAKKIDGAVPTWQGGRMPLSNTLASEIQSILGEVKVGNRAITSSKEMRFLSGILKLQGSVSDLPSSDILLIEHCTTRRGFHVFFYPFAGRSAHEGMAALFALRWGREHPNTFSYALNDYGFMLTLDLPQPVTQSLLGTLLEGNNLMQDLIESVNLSELSRRHFREIARVAGLIAPSLPGRLARSMRQIQATSGLIYDVFKRYDPDHILLKQAKAEVIEYELELPRIAESLRDIKSRELKIVSLQRLSPFSFSLWADGLRGQLSNELWQVRIARAAERIERAYARRP